MSDPIKWTDIVVAVAAAGAVAISVGSAVIAELARRDSKRSADAAEKSAQEAKKTSDIAQTDLLAEHFLNADYIFDVAEGKSTHGNYRERSLAGKQSVKFLKNIIQNDTFHGLIDEVVSILDNRSVVVWTGCDDDSGKEKLRAIEARVALLRKDYEVTKRNCLNMKVG
jgi:hypothetical protein